MTDFHLIVFLDNQKLGIDTKIGFISGTVLKYWIFDIQTQTQTQTKFIQHK